MGNANVQFVPSTPKRNGEKKTGKAGFYDFYPGYSTTFVADVLQHWNLPRKSVILDPWNGSGTTTGVASTLGYRAIGYDLNPVMFVVAKAREIPVSHYLRLSKTKKKIIEQAKRYRKHPLFETDPLGEWFTSETVKTLRAIERSVQSTFFQSAGYVCLFNNEKVLLSISSEVAFFYLALFRVLKELSFSFRSSNPTWVKKPKSFDEREQFSRELVFRSFEQNVNELLELLQQNVEPGDSSGETVLGLSDSEGLPLESSTVDAVITSPPYCTRIDYAILTRLELALLGSNDNSLTQLRKRLIGTPLIHTQKPKLDSKWGITCSKTVNKINNHESKASKTYYYQTFLQYFHSLYRSLLEIDRVLKMNGKCTFVVQNSYYKDIYIDLGTILSEMGESLKWETTHQFDYYSKQTMLWINTKSNKYRDDTKGKETVLFFQKRS